MDRQKKTLARGMNCRWCVLAISRMLAVQIDEFNKPLVCYRASAASRLFLISPHLPCGELFRNIPPQVPHKMAARCLTRPLTSRLATNLSSRLVRPYSQSLSTKYENILVDSPKPGVGLSMPPLIHPPFPLPKWFYERLLIQPHPPSHP